MKSWEFKPEETSAAHDSGLIVRYQRLPMPFSPVLPLPSLKQGIWGENPAIKTRYHEKYPGKSLVCDGQAWYRMGKKKPANLGGMRVSGDFIRLS